MNIFALHPKPRKAARWHADRHVVKMILETAQLLYTAHWVLCYPALTEKGCRALLATLSAPPWMLGAPKGGYRPTHANHPCAVWARQTLGNYRWLVELGLELAREYTHRYGRIHACVVHLEWLEANEPWGIRRVPRRTPFACAMPEYIEGLTPVERYQEYYRKEKQHLLQYTRRHPPHWFRGPLRPAGLPSPLPLVRT
jgi:hypothetical protein